MTRTIEQTATYAFTTKTIDPQFTHGSAYGDQLANVTYTGENQDGTHEWTVEDVTMPDRLEELFDTDGEIVSYYQVQPLVYADDEE